MSTPKSVYIHQSADVSDAAKIGDGSYIWHESQIRERARIGQNCKIGKGVYVDFDVRIGDNCKIQNRASIYHGTTVADGVFIGPHVVFTNDKLPRAINPDGSQKLDEDWDVGPIEVARGASFGAGCIILPGVNIGEFALIGAGALVTRDVPAFGIVVGNPARMIGFACACGNKLEAVLDGYECVSCGRRYSESGIGLVLRESQEEIGK